MTAQAGAHEKVLPGTLSRKDSRKNVVGSAPQASFTE